MIEYKKIDDGLGIRIVKEIHRCPVCERVLWYKPSVHGWVCKNWKCTNFWKYGKGQVFFKEKK